jgi:hypothetical protein
MARNIKKKVKLEKDISYLNKDFEAFRNELIQYARVNYSDKITDFTPAGLGGAFVDIAAYVGDVMSFYLDHQFNELNLETAVEEKNLERLIRTAGVKATPKSPATAIIDITVTIPARTYSGSKPLPDRDLLPNIKNGTILSSTAGTNFTLLDDVDFSMLKDNGTVDAEIAIATTDSNNNPTSFFLTKKGTCTSALTKLDTFALGNTFKQFRTLGLREDNVSEIIFVKDSISNEYYEVENLTQDTVFKRVVNDNEDNDLVDERLEMIPAPRRFVKEYSRQTGKTSILFGSGREEIFDDDVIPDPSENALPLYGDRKTFNSISIDPNKFLETQTLGVSPRNTVITVSYRHGGGIKDNVPAGSINSVKTLITAFKTIPTAVQVNNIRGSVIINNPDPAGGGEDEPNLNELRNIALNFRNSQNRIVSKSDLLARVYTLPNNFGRVFRAGVSDNPNNPLATRLFIISRDSNKNLIISPDTLKENLVTYLNKFRLISDAIDILDAPIINIGIKYGIVVEKGYNYQSVLNKVNSELIEYFQIENFQIDQPVVLSDVSNLIINIPGVFSLVSFKFISRGGSGARASLAKKGLNYSNYDYDPRSNISKGMLIPPDGGIFEIKYPQQDIVGRVI